MSELTLVIATRIIRHGTLRAWLYLKHTGARFNEIRIGLDRPDTKERIAKHSPSGRVPVLIDGSVTDRSHWRSGFMMEKPLVELRRDLAALGLGRKPESTQVEDHISALFETMRLLIEGDSTRSPANLSVQRGFFETHIGSWVFDLCTALKDCPLANFYRPVAEFAELFMALERDSLAIE